MSIPPLDYIPSLISAYRAGHASDHVHLGYWATGADHDWPTAPQAMTELHLDALAPDHGQTVVDVGCGIGGSLRMANTRIRNARLVGVNIDPRQLEICMTHRASAGNRFEWVESDAGSIALADGSADRVLSLEAMFHFPSRRRFLAEVARLLRPQGVLVCSDILFGEPRTDEEKHLLDIVQSGYAPWPAPVVKPDDIKTMAQEVGLTLIDTTDLSEHVMPTWDHILSKRDHDKDTALAAMRRLHRAGRLRYQIFVFRH